MNVDLSPLPADFTGWTVYSLRDANGVAVYVGCSSSPRTRMSHHRKRTWWGEVATVTHEITLDNKRDALDTEMMMIREMQPRHNVRGTPREVAVFQAARRKGAERRRQREGPQTRAALEAHRHWLIKQLTETQGRLDALDEAGAA